MRWAPLNWARRTSVTAVSSSCSCRSSWKMAGAGKVSLWEALLWHHDDHLCPVMLLMAASVLGLGFGGRLPEKDWAESGGPWFKPGLGAWRVQLGRRTRRSLWLLPSPAETAARTGQHFFFFSLFFFFFFSLCIVFWCAFVFSMWFHSDIRRSENIGWNAKLLVLITCDNKKLF